MKKTVVFDFDGVIHSYTTPWIATNVIPDNPVEGIREAIMDLQDAGYEVVVVSTRCSSPGGIEAVEAYLKYFHIPVDKVMAEKPPAVVYISAEQSESKCWVQCLPMLRRKKKRDGVLQLWNHRLRDFWWNS